MPKLMKKAIHLRRTDGQTDPNYRKASLLKTDKFKYIINYNNKQISLNVELEYWIKGLDTDSL